MKKISKKYATQLAKHRSVFLDINKMLIENNKPVEADGANEEQLQFLGLVTDTITNNEQTIKQAETAIVTKADISRKIWAEELAKVNDGEFPVRGVTIKRLIAEANLTKAGAATYYQNMKKKFGFVKSAA